ncbi:hypothetical protein [Absidia glauca]|uniref:C2H2-type domain-containing protein n=1 Tax=Absidia glauca TaxID=4829 RepID=A0A163JTA3_ABSGL|nr:hypothetical protein [Absidia glauca]
MSPFNRHDVSSLNWNDKTFQRKEVGYTLPYASSKMIHWPLSYDNATSTAAVGSPFKPHATSNSPVMSTPYLESSVDDVFSPVCHSPFATMSPHLNHHHIHHPHHHQCQQQSIHHLQQATDISVGPYIDKETTIKVKQEIPFTGDPMELLIDKSKVVNTSPTVSSSDDIITPLFMPILFHDGQQQDQQQMYTPNGQSFMMGQDSMDWSCYENGNALLFQALDGLLETPPSSDTGMCDALHQHQSSPSPSTSHQSLMLESVNGASESLNKKKSLQEQENTSSSSSNNNNNNNKKKRNTSKERTSTSSSTARSNAKRTKTNATNTNEKRYGCPICRRKFSRRYNLNTHIRTHNANRIKEFACDICGTGFDLLVFYMIL